MVICGKPSVTWFVASTNQRHSAFLIPHFTFRIPHSAIPHFTHSPPWFRIRVRVRVRVRDRDRVRDRGGEILRERRLQANVITRELNTSGHKHELRRGTLYTQAVGTIPHEHKDPIPCSER